MLLICFCIFQNKQFFFLLYDIKIAVDVINCTAIFSLSILIFLLKHALLTRIPVFVHYFKEKNLKSNNFHILHKAFCLINKFARFLFLQVPMLGMMDS